MNMHDDLRRTSLATAALYCDLRDIAPVLSGLTHSRTIPDTALQVILDWSDTVAAPDVDPPFELDRLRALLPALVVAFVAEHTYTCAGPDGGGGCIDLHDEGCGALVADVMELTAAIAIVRHGADGRRLVEAARADLGRHLHRITELIAGR
jgi:hypothetical protein